MQQTKSFNTVVCVPDLVIIKYFGNNTIEVKRIVFTYPDLLPSAFVVELYPNCKLSVFDLYSYEVNALLITMKPLYYVPL